MKVQKFGGTSLGTPESMLHISNIINDGEQKIVVLSAIAGTTNKLIYIIDLVKKYQIKEALVKILELKYEYEKYISVLFTSKDHLSQLEALIAKSFEKLYALNAEDLTDEYEREILAQGELLSSEIFHFLLETLGQNSRLIYALNFMRTDKDCEPDMYYIKSNIKKCMHSAPEAEVYITQGYICRNYFGEIDNLGRDGSDYSASLIGSVLDVNEIQIWTDVDGVHNNDPRMVSSTMPIKELSYREAAELSYFGAAILHPKCVFPAQVKNIPLKLKNTFKSDAPGTLISSTSRRDKVKSVAAKDGIIAIRIRSARMLMAYGFLRKVFQVFEDHETPIDMISTSEISVSLTIDNPKNLDTILADLIKFGEVEYDLDQTIVCVVGDFMAEETGMARTVLDAFKDIPVRMISYGGSMNNISLLVKSADKKRSLESLHQKFFNKHFSYA
ncbi:MAG: aspartate kinase [Bacteroidales bacterium]|nr:aspartate kinase [Bacteroidales bacterium]